MMAIDRAGKLLRSETGRRLALTMVAAAFGRLGSLLLAVVIGRSFGPADYGAFAFATSTVTVLAAVALLGWQTLMNLLIPKMRSEQDWDGLKGLRDAADALVLSTSLILALILVIVSRLTADLSIGFLLAALLILPVSVAVLRSEQLAALKLPALGLLFDQSVGAFLTILFLLAVGGVGLVQTVIFYASAILLGNVVTTYFVRKHLPNEVATARRSVRLGEWMNLSIPMFFGVFSRLLMSRADVLMLAPLAGLYQSGLYGAAFRITLILTFPQSVLLSVLTPLISEAFAENRAGRLRNLIASASLFSMLTAVPTTILLICFPEAILAFLFGDEFRPAGMTLIVIALAQLATSLALPFQAMLTMGGQERKYGGLLIGALAFQVLLNFILIPQYGAVGVAISTLIVSVLVAAVQIALNLPVLRPR